MLDCEDGTDGKEEDDDVVEAITQSNDSMAERLDSMVIATPRDTAAAETPGMHPLPYVCAR